MKDLRSVQELWWKVDQPTGWHVILGNNGAGKTTFLRSVALALVGNDNLQGLRQSGDDWLRRGSNAGEVQVEFDRGEGFDVFSRAGAPPRGLRAVVRVTRPDDGEAYLAPEPVDDQRSLDRSVWASDSRGWVTCGFGPYRRFSGGVPMVTPPRASLARTLSLFDEQFSLTDALSWLVDLWTARQVDGAPMFDSVQKFINQSSFLPHGVRLDRVELSPSKRVLFADASGAAVPVAELSDGFRSALSLVLEMVRHLVLAFGESRVFTADAERIDIPFVALIDEVDAHLHPTWQRRIGEFFVNAFPRTQFIVSTHSPLVCQGSAAGTIFLLPEPGTGEQGRFLDDAERNRLRFGNVLDAYGTNVFGVGVGQSEDGKQKAERLAELNGKELFAGGLTPDEQTERDELRKILPTRAAELPGAKVDELVERLTSSKDG